MTPLRVLLVDDERLARQRLAALLRDQPAVTLAGEAADLSQAIALLAGNPPDVVFLDVVMPPESGFDLLPMFRRVPMWCSSPPMCCMRSVRSRKMPWTICSSRSNRSGFQAADGGRLFDASMMFSLSNGGLVTLDRAAALRSAGPFAGSRSRGWRLLELPVRFVPPVLCDSPSGQGLQLLLRT